MMVLRMLFIAVFSLIGLMLSASSDGVSHFPVMDPGGGEKANGQAPIAELPDAACERSIRRVVVVKASVGSGAYDQGFSHWNVYLNLDSSPGCPPFADAGRTR